MIIDNTWHNSPGVPVGVPTGHWLSSDPTPVPVEVRDGVSYVRADVAVAFARHVAVEDAELLRRLGDE